MVHGSTGARLIVHVGGDTTGSVKTSAVHIMDWETKTWTAGCLWNLLITTYAAEELMWRAAGNPLPHKLGAQRNHRGREDQREQGGHGLRLRAASRRQLDPGGEHARREELADRGDRQRGQLSRVWLEYIQD